MSNYNNYSEHVWPRNFPITDMEENDAHALFVHNTPISLHREWAPPSYGLILNIDDVEEIESIDCSHYWSGTIHLIESSEIEVKQMLKSAGQFTQQFYRNSNYTKFKSDVNCGSVLDTLLFWEVPGQEGKYIVVCTIGPDRVLKSWSERDDLFLNSIKLKESGDMRSLPTTWSEGERAIFYDKFTLSPEEELHNDFWNMLKSCSKESSNIIKQREELDGNISRALDDSKLSVSDLKFKI